MKKLYSDLWRLWWILPIVCAIGWIWIFLRAPSTWNLLNTFVGVAGVSLLGVLTWIKTVRNNVVFRVILNLFAIIFLLVLLLKDIDGRGGCNICEAWNGSDAFSATRIHKNESRIDEECYRKFEKASMNIPDNNQDGDPFFDICEPNDAAKLDSTWGSVEIASGVSLAEPKPGESKRINEKWKIRFQNPLFKISGVARYRVFLTTKELEDVDGEMQYFQVLCTPQKLQPMTECEVPILENTDWYQYAVPGTQPRKIYWRVRAELQNGDSRWILDKAEDGEELYFIPNKS